MGSRDQLDLFETRAPTALFDETATPIQYRADPDKVRARLHAILAEAKAAKKIPWEPAQVQLYLTIFPQMTNWLPADEATRLCLEFEMEMARLKAA
jgi:hypothetical protein